MDSVAYYAYGCPVHWSGWDHSERRCSCRLASDNDGGKPDNLVASRRQGESDEVWATRREAAIRRYTKGA